MIWIQRLNQKTINLNRSKQMGKNIKGLAGSIIFNQKTVNKMNGINKNKKGEASPIYIPLKKRK